MVRPLAKALAAVFVGLSASLLALDYNSIPQRDMVAAFVATATVVEVQKRFQSPSPPNVPNPEMKTRMRRVFSRLSFLEIVATIIIPWALILQELFHGPRGDIGDATAIYILAPHLFIFQMQICLESHIMTKTEAMLFPFTIGANAYRFFPLLTWISRTGWEMRKPGSQYQQIHYALALTGLVLWTYSTFYFIPWEWWPVLQNAKKAHPHK